MSEIMPTWTRHRTMTFQICHNLPTWTSHNKLPTPTSHRLPTSTWWPNVINFFVNTGTPRTVSISTVSSLVWFSRIFFTKVGQNFPKLSKIPVIFFKNLCQNYNPCTFGHQFQKIFYCGFCISIWLIIYIMNIWLFHD